MAVKVVVSIKEELGGRLVTMDTSVSSFDKSMNAPVELDLVCVVCRSMDIQTLKNHIFMLEMPKIKKAVLNAELVEVYYRGKLVESYNHREKILSDVHDLLMGGMMFISNPHTVGAAAMNEEIGKTDILGVSFSQNNGTISLGSNHFDRSLLPNILEQLV